MRDSLAFKKFSSKGNQPQEHFSKTTIVFVFNDFIKSVFALLVMTCLDHEYVAVHTGIGTAPKILLIETNPQMIKQSHFQSHNLINPYQE